ncbi:MAG: hypothetical protein SF123_00225 [Chloroflexota bacterium]|nr:hypothetical protein [Chloroflexota bacterium]
MAPPTHIAPDIQEAFFMPDDPFDADWSAAWEVVEAEPLPFMETEDLFGALPSDDEASAWHDARLIGVCRPGDDPRYEIGCIDLYADADGRNPAGQYVPLANFGDEAVATAFYYDVQGEADAQGLLKSELPDFAFDRAQAFDPDAAWRPATAEEIDAYSLQREFEEVSPLDVPPEPLHEQLIAQGAALGSGGRNHDFEDPSAFHALREIGIDAGDFDPAQDPPPFYDAQTGTAYWIGVFQPDRDDRNHCLTSILSLEKTDDGYAAQLAPCVPGDWDKAHEAAAFLILQAQKGGIERALDAAEGMALATDQRDLWEAERGLALDATATQDLVDYAAQWEIER